MIIFLLALVAMVGFISWKQNSVTEINYNQTYTFNAKRTTGAPPSYIVFLDESHYLAIPELNLENDCNQAFGVDFIQGTYRKREDVYKFEKKGKVTNLWFDNYENFEAGKYTIQRGKINAENKYLTFASGTISKERLSFVYKQIIRIYNSGKTDRYKRNNFKLKRTKFNIPTTEKEFIQRYHKKQSHQQE